MKRVIEAFHVGRTSERAIGLIQVILVVLVVLGTIGITRLIRSGGDTGPDMAASLEHVVVDTVSPKPTRHTISRTLTGEVEARASVTIVPQVAGRVLSISPSMAPGMIVPAGEALFTIDPTDFELAVEQAKAQVASAEAELMQTQATAENFIKDWLRVFPNEPAPALVAKEPQVKALEARLRSAKAAVAQAELNLARTRYQLDYDARITDSRIERGQLLITTGQYGSLYALDGLRVRASLSPDELNLLQLSPGSTVTIQPELADAAPIEATVTSVGGALSGTTRLQTAFIELPDGIGLVPGAFVSVQANHALDGEVYELPAASLATTESVWTVSAGKLKRVEVEIVDSVRDRIYVRPFDAADGVVTTEVPTSFINRPVDIRRHDGAAK
jgi:RND family efflux transporter MFP subunit